jgi:hypothetical protein
MRGRVREKIRSALALPAQLRDGYRSTRPLFTIVRHIASGPAEERDVALENLQVWTQEIRLRTARDRARESVKGFAKELLFGDYGFGEALDQVPHLGALSPLTSVHASRLDYVLLCCNEILRLKNAFPYLGLGSKHANIRHNERHLSGLEVAQTLSILLNSAHLFGTFATERGLQYQIDDQPQLRRTIIQLAPSALHKWSEKVLDQGSLYRFHYAIAAARLGQLSLPKPIATTAIDALLTFSATTNQGNNKINWAFRSARQLAYQQLHSFLRLGLSLDPQVFESLAEQLLEDDVLGYDPRAASTPVGGVLRAMDRVHSEAAFTSPSAATLVLKHLRAFRKWWLEEDAHDTKLWDRLLSLKSKPDNWPNEGGAQLRHFVRLRLPTSQGWTSEVRRWRQDGSWGPNGTFLVTPVPTDDTTIVDVYESKPLDCASRRAVARALSQDVAASWTFSEGESARIVWRSAAIFGARLLRDLLVGGHRVWVEPVEPVDAGGPPHAGYAMVCSGDEPGRSKLCELERRFDDERCRELLALVEVKKKLGRAGRRDTAPWLAFLGRVFILNERTGDRVAEIDGIWAELHEDSIDWLFVEHKSSLGRGPKRQLNQLRRIITLSSNEPRDVSLEGNGTAAALTLRQLA